MKLNPLQVKKAKPQSKTYKLWDGYHGLHLVISPKGTKTWKVKYRFNNKEKLYTIGRLDSYSLADARKEALDIKAKVGGGEDVAATKAAAKKEQLVQQTVEQFTFEQVADQWWDQHSKEISQATYDKKYYILDHYLKPPLKGKPIESITTATLLPVLTTIGQHSPHTAKVARTIFNQVAQYAILNGWASQNAALHLRGALPKIDHSRRYPSIKEPAAVGGLMRVLAALREDTFVIGTALEVLARTAARPGEVRAMMWQQVDLEEGTWSYRIAKTKQDIVTPLSKQVVKLLRDLQPYTEHSDWVFPGRVDSRTISENTFNVTLRRGGIGKDQHVAHGFRHMFSTLAHGHGCEPHIIEFQLGHKHGSSVAQRYNAAVYLPQRREMLQWYSDYLDQLRDAK